MFKKVFYNAISQILGKIATASTTLLVTVLIGRSLGPSGFGEFTKIFAFVGYFYTIVDFGLNSIYVKTVDDKSEIKVLRVLAGLRLLIALIFVVAAISIAFFLPYNPSQQTGFSPLVKTGITFASLTILTQALYTTANAFFQRNLRYDLSTIAAVFASLVILGVTIAVSFWARSPLPYVGAYVLGGLILVSSAYWLIYLKSKRLILPTLDLTASLRLISSAWPVGLALIFNLIYFRIDVFILASFRSSTEVGLYGLSYQFFEASLAVPIFFVNAIYPLLAKVYKENLTNFTKLVQSWFWILVFAAVMLMVLLFAVSYLIPFIFDARFTASQDALRILALGLPFFFISALLWHLLIIYGKQKYLTYIYGFGAIFNLVVNLILIPPFGYLAAALTTVISEGMILLLLALVSVRIVRENA